MIPSPLALLLAGAPRPVATPAKVARLEASRGSEAPNQIFGCQAVAEPTPKMCRPMLSEDWRFVRMGSPFVSQHRFAKGKLLSVCTRYVIAYADSHGNSESRMDKDLTRLGAHLGLGSRRFAGSWCCSSSRRAACWRRFAETSSRRQITQPPTSA